MRSAGASPSPTTFLGVRLTLEESDLLDRFQRARGLPNRSEAVRALVRAADRLAERPLELPATLENEIEEIAADGYGGDRDAALAVVLNFGLAELERVHAERFSALRRHAKELADRAAARKGADREAGERLER